MSVDDMVDQNQASMVCVPCKRRKKGCDKKLPICSRCERYPNSHSHSGCSTNISRLNATCCYPKEISGTDTHSEPRAVIALSSSTLGRPSPAMLSHASPNFDEIAVNTLHSLSEHVETSQAEEDFAHYFSIYHINLPIVSKDDFARKLQQNCQDPHYILLKLAISTVAQLTSDKPDAFHRGRDLYSPLKAVHSQYQSSSTCSIDLLLAGLLIATYEYCQDLLQQSWFTIGGCVRMGQILKLEHGIAKVQILPVWWWGIVILERLLCYSTSCVADD